MGDSDPSTTAHRPSRRQRWLFKLLNVYPPFLGAGIRVKRVAPDHSWCEVEMKLRRFNRNAVGTHFGGSLYAMCDPFFMLILLEHLGPDYIVWDKAATIRFRRPGRGTVSARFEIPLAEIESIRRRADVTSPVEPKLTVKIVDERGQVVAEVDKLLYVARKRPKG